MQYKTILVHFDREERVKSLLQYVLPLAREQGAHVIGLAVMPSLLKIPASELGTLALIDDVRSEFATIARRMQGVFEESMRGQTFTGEWRVADPGFRETMETIAEAGSQADLIIAHQDEPGDPGNGQSRGLLAVLSARPLLLLPVKNIPASPPRRIVAAWDGSRPSARAIFDAFPLFKGAEAVSLLTVRWPDEFIGDTEAPPDEVRHQQGIDICDTLARHGIDATVTLKTPWDDDIGKTLLAETASCNADLLVMGGYGHSRLREWVFGGVTRSILDEMETPVLLSH